MIFLTIGTAILLFLIFGFYKASQLQNIEIIQKATIKADKQKVFDMVKYLKNFPKWSPFLVQDPKQKYEVKGIDGTIGAQYHWNGNKGKDLGYQEIYTIKELEFIGMKCDIQKPFVAKPTFDYTFTKNEKGITVHQTFKLKSGIIDAFFMWLFGAKKEMEKTNQLGMELLKKAITK